MIEQSRVRDPKKEKKEKIMKETKLYECEICGTRYADRCACETCEGTHKKPKKITGARYLPYKQNKGGYPQTITVEFEDGKRIAYKA